MRKLLPLLLFIFLGGIFLGDAFAIESDETLSVVEGIAGDDNFSTLVSLLEQAGLVEDLRADGPFTVFAPSNGVFEALSEEGVDLSADPNLRQTLVNHVIQGAYSVLELRNAEEGGSFTTLDGGAFDVELGAGGLSVNGVGLDSTDVDNVFRNGVVHVVDGVMTTPSDVTGGAETEETAEAGTAETETAEQSEEGAEAAGEEVAETEQEAASEEVAGETETESAVADAEATAEAASEQDEATLLTVLQNDGRFGTLLSALEQAGLSGLFEDAEAGPLTLFAPTDDAFSAVPEEQMASLLNDGEMLSRVLSYHVAEGQLLAGDLEDGATVTTLAGEDLTINLADGVTINETPVVEADLEASNGVTHVIESVLLPADLELSDEAAEEAQTEEGVAAEEQTSEQTEEADTTDTDTTEATDTAADNEQDEATESAQQSQATEGQAAQPADPNAAAQVQDTQVQDAQVRVAHLSPNAPAVDINLTSTLENGEALAPEAFTGLSYEATTDFSAVPADEYMLTVTSEGNPVLEQDISLAPGMSYTLAVIGLVLPEGDAEAPEEEGGFFNFIQDLFSGDRERDSLALQVLVVEDDLYRAFGEDESLVRVVHASPGTEAVDLVVDGAEEPEIVVNDVAFGEVADYGGLATGFSAPRLRLAGSDAATIELDSAGLEPGMITTVYLIGTTLEQAPLSTLSFSDAPQSPPDAATNETQSPDANPAQATVADVVMDTADLSTLAAALEQTGLLESLRGPGPFTLLAPSEEAFSALPEDQFGALLEDEEALTRVLSNHVVQGALPSSELASAGSVASLDGAELEVVAGEDSSVTVGNAAVVVPDLQASNGVVHIIDTVLLPEDLELSSESEAAQAETETEAAQTQTEDTTSTDAGAQEAASEQTQEEQSQEGEEGTETQTEDAGAATSQSGDTSAAQAQNVQVRVSHLSPNAPAVNVTFTSTTEDGETIAPEALGGLDYEATTDYVDLPVGEYTVSVEAENNTVLEQDVFFDIGMTYTLAVVGLVLPEEDAEAPEEEGGFFSFIQDLFSGDRDRDTLALQLLVLQDNVDFAPVEGETLVRVIHAAPGTAAVNLTVAGDGERDTVLDGIEFGSVSRYATLAALREPAITIAGSDSLALDLADVSFEPRKVVTLIVTGTSLEQAPLQVIALNDEPRLIPRGSAATGAGGTITSVIATDPSLATLTSLLGEAGLLERLDGPGPFTLFAPNEAAFAALEPERLEALLADEVALERVINNHIVERSATAADIAAAGSVSTLDGTSLELAEDQDGNLSVGNGFVVVADLEASNGVIHVIDTVLLPEDLELPRIQDESEEGENGN